MPSTNLLNLNYIPNPDSKSSQSVFQHPSISPPLTPKSLISSSPVSEITFYRDGDLILELYNQDNEKVHLTVASAALCIASPVFRAMLSPDGFREGKALSSCIREGNVFILQLPDDDPEPFITLCHILHFNNQKVTRKITTDSLAKLCVLLDKYVCTMAAISWLDFWFSHVPQPDTNGKLMKLKNPPCVDVNQQVDDVKWLYISYVAGDNQRFMQYSAKVLMDLPSLDHMSDTYLEWFERLPGTIQDALVHTSQEVIQGIARLMEEFCLGKLSKCQATPLSLQDDNAAAGFRRSATVPTPRDCEAHAIGAFVQSLQIISALYVLAQPSWWSGSANELLDKMEEIADNLASSRVFVPPHQHCCHGRTLYKKLKELRYSKNTKGLDLSDFSGHGNGFGDILVV